jgi:hypothetical protein
MLQRKENKGKMKKGQMDKSNQNTAIDKKKTKSLDCVELVWFICQGGANWH